MSRWGIKEAPRKDNETEVRLGGDEGTYMHDGWQCSAPWHDYTPNKSHASVEPHNAHLRNPLAHLALPNLTKVLWGTAEIGGGGYRAEALAHAAGGEGEREREGTRGKALQAKHVRKAQPGPAEVTAAPWRRTSEWDTGAR